LYAVFYLVVALLLLKSSLAHISWLNPIKGERVQGVGIDERLLLWKGVSIAIFWLKVADIQEVFALAIVGPIQLKVVLDVRPERLVHLLLLIKL